MAAGDEQRRAIVSGEVVDREERVDRGDVTIEMAREVAMEYRWKCLDRRVRDGRIKPF